jgi:hypothetical protein
MVDYNFTAAVDYNCSYYKFHRVLGDADTAAACIPVWTKVCTLLNYCVVWVLLMFPSLVPLGRPATALLGAAIALFFRYAEAGGYEDDEGYPMPDVFTGRRLPNGQSVAYIDWVTIQLLFGLMIVVLYLADSGAMQKVKKFINVKRGWGRMKRIILITAISSPFLMNDGACLVFTPVVVQVCQEHQVDCFPYLLSLASTANIGSVLTIYGNPQNQLIASASSPPLGYMPFLSIMLLPTLLGLLFNTTCLYFYYGKALDQQTTADDGDSESLDQPLLSDISEEMPTRSENQSESSVGVGTGFIRIQRSRSDDSSFSPSVRRRRAALANENATSPSTNFFAFIGDENPEISIPSTADGKGQGTEAMMASINWVLDAPSASDDQVRVRESRRESTRLRYAYASCLLPCLRLSRQPSRMQHKTAAVISFVQSGCSLRRITFVVQSGCSCALSFRVFSTKDRTSCCS